MKILLQGTNFGKLLERQKFYFAITKLKISGFKSKFNNNQDPRNKKNCSKNLELFQLIISF